MLLQSNLHSKKAVFTVIGNETKLMTKLVLSAQGPFKAGLCLLLIVTRNGASSA